MMGSIRIEDFLTNTAIAYMLLVIGFLLVGLIAIKTGEPKPSRR